jgi:hypothetical protein
MGLRSFLRSIGRPMSLELETNKIKKATHIKSQLNQ